MKRIQSACLEQTIRFELSENLPREEAAAAVKKELESYKAGMDRRRIRYRVIEESTEPDGSILLKIKKQYNSYRTGEYLQ